MSRRTSASGMIPVSAGGNVQYMFPGNGNEIVSVQPNTTSDSAEVVYRCGHKLAVTTAIAARYAYPAVCVTCRQERLNQQWIDQEEWKGWTADPRWAGFQPATVANADVGSYVMPNYTPLGWLDHELHKVTGRFNG